MKRTRPRASSTCHAAPDEGAGTWLAPKVTRQLTVVMIGALSLIAACSSGPQPRDDSPTTAASPRATTVTATTDPQAVPAIEAYQAFWRAANEAERHPVKAGSTYPPEADFARYSFDPLRSAYI